jgi:aryl-alcohol dehydrogenase-like predicted oxidoreductase
MGLVSEQSFYNLRDRMIELEVIPACREYGLGLIPWSPLGGGMLAGGVVDAQVGRRSQEWVQDALPNYRTQVEAYEAFCAERDLEPAQVALAWLLKNPDVTAPIIGPRTMDQLESALAALELELSDEDMARLDEIWPGPGGEAPEAYAW